MSPNTFLYTCCSFLLLSMVIQGCGMEGHDSLTVSDEKPNIVLIFLDDAGFADFQPFAETRYPTPNVLRLAEEGRRFQNFYVPSAVCSASRAALLTGTYPERSGMFGAHGPRQRGLDPGLVTMGEMFQNHGYVTAAFGKWHLGDQEDTRSHVRGFDETSGIMYSNDMWADHPEAPEYWGQWPLQYWENGEVTIDSVTAADQPHFTTWFTEDSVDFINRHSGQPFFLYVPHPMPHVPLFVSDKFAGASGTGLYGDVIMELDWSLGEIMNALEDNGVKENTIIIFTSDNGPWLTYGNHSGQTPYREGKGTSFDGGIRSPLLISWPGHIKPNSVSHDTFFSIDFLPTLANLTGAELPDYEIDGKDIWELITGENTENPHDYYAFHFDQQLQGVFSGDGKWKLILPHSYRTIVRGGIDGSTGVNRQQPIDEHLLFDMVHDPFEKVNVIHEYPEIFEKLKRFADEHNARFFE
ncbi:MAG: arylsulfatase [Balneolaceae bacterium]|nr:MAG: arylsulfatase [Balneolaceae bacterium]